MAEIIDIKKIVAISVDIKAQERKIVLVGGCFDILHPGHIVFLDKAKKTGDILVVMLESDKKIRELKGLKRPVHSQKERAAVLAALNFVDYIVMLPYIKNNLAYGSLIKKINPDVIAVTKGEDISHHQRAANLVGAKLKFVTKMIGNYSSSRILNR